MIYGSTLPEVMVLFSGRIIPAGKFVAAVSTFKEIPSLQLINQTLGYARELERIV
jgi:hypothetical protein